MLMENFFSSHHAGKSEWDEAYIPDFFCRESQRECDVLQGIHPNRQPRAVAGKGCVQLFLGLDDTAQLLVVKAEAGHNCACRVRVHCFF